MVEWKKEKNRDKLKKERQKGKMEVKENTREESEKGIKIWKK